MQTLILEGIATSGKSTIIGMLDSRLKKKCNVKIILEVDTITVIANNTDTETSIAHLRSLIHTVFENPSDVVIFDRLYLTHIFRTHDTIKEYALIENILLPYSPFTVFLKVNEDSITERISKASEHRKPEWKKYISTKGKTIDEIAAYYIKQQRNQLKLLGESVLPYKVYDTSKHDYETIVSDILNNIVRID